MKFCFDYKIKNFLNLIKSAASKKNQRVFIVGGAVRDYFLNIPVKDIDLILEGNAIDLADSLPNKIQVKSVHKDFGTIKLKYSDLEFDLASTREEEYPFSGCLPVVKNIGCTIEKDVLRRDFTVNSMYAEILDSDDFQNIDILNGISDLKNKELRSIHEKSYIDDPTRILRGLGFKYRFNFDFSAKDKLLIQEYLNNIDYSNMSIDRAFSVFKKTLNTDYNLDMFSEIIEKKYYKILTKEDIRVNFKLTAKIKDMFKLSKEDFSAFCEKIILNAPHTYEKPTTTIDILKQYSKYSCSELAYIYYKTSDNGILDYLKYKNIKPVLKGDDLIKIGYKQGKIIGEILDSLWAEKLENTSKLTTFTEEINWVKNNFPIN